MSDTTLAYYDRQAKAYADQTFGADVSDLHVRFLAILPRNARVLDAGCGSGRDALAFARAGCDVLAFDASPEMVAEAARRTGLPVVQLRFQELDAREEFDGIWAFASLLHVPMADELDVWARLRDALVPDGVLYVAFKVGAGERMDGERLFRDHDEMTLASLVSAVGGLRIMETWLSGDTLGRNSVQWLNALIVRTDVD